MAATASRDADGTVDGELEPTDPTPRQSSARDGSIRLKSDYAPDGSAAEGRHHERQPDEVLSATTSDADGVTGTVTTNQVLTGPTPKSSAQTAASAKSSTTQMGQLRKPTTAQTDNWPQQRPVTSMGRSRRTKLTVPTPKSSAQTAASAKSSTTQMGQLRKPTTAQTDNWPQQRPVTSMGRSRRTKLTVPTTQIVRPDGSISEIQYDPDGSAAEADYGPDDGQLAATATRDVNGTVTTNQADGSHTQIVRPDGSISEIQYDPDGSAAEADYGPDGQLAATATRDVNGTVTTNQADGSHTQIVRPDGSISEIQYDPDGSAAEADYGPDGQLAATATRDVNGMVTTNQADGTFTHVIHPEGSTSEVQYGPDGSETEVDYSPDGKVSANLHRDGKGTTTYTSTDGTFTHVTHPEGSTSKVWYGPDGSETEVD